MRMFSPRSSAFGWGTMSTDDEGPLPRASLRASEVRSAGEAAILVRGLYPPDAPAPGVNLFRGKPVGPGTAVRVGLKSGAPWKWITAGPNLFWLGLGLPRVTGLTEGEAPSAE